MPKMRQFTPEFKDQAVRFVLEEIEPNESRKEACRRLASKVNVKEVTLCNWVKAASPLTDGGTARAGQAGTVEELRATVSALRMETVSWPARTTWQIQAASAFFGAELDRQSKR